MKIAGVDKKSVLKLSKLLNRSVEDILNDEYGFPLYIGKDGYMTLDDALENNNLSMFEFYNMLRERKIGLILKEFDCEVYACRDIFRDFFFENSLKKPEYGENYIIDKKLFLKMLRWLKKKLKSISIYNAYVSEDTEYDEFYIDNMINVCKSMLVFLEKINWENTLVYYEWDN